MTVHLITAIIAIMCCEDCKHAVLQKIWAAQLALCSWAPAQTWECIRDSVSLSYSFDVGDCLLENVTILGLKPTITTIYKDDLLIPCSKTFELVTKNELLDFLKGVGAHSIGRTFRGSSFAQTSGPIEHQDFESNAFYQVTLNEMSQPEVRFVAAVSWFFESRVKWRLVLVLLRLHRPLHQGFWFEYQKDQHRVASCCCFCSSWEFNGRILPYPCLLYKTFLLMVCLNTINTYQYQRPNTSKSCWQLRLFRISSDSLLQIRERYTCTVHALTRLLSQTRISDVSLLAMQLGH